MRQNDVTWCDFLQEKQVELLLSHSLFAAENIKNLLLALRTCKKIGRAQLVDKSNAVGQYICVQKNGYCYVS